MAVVAASRTDGAVDSGEQLYAWAADLFPICRSITGQGLRDSLRYLASLLPELQIHAIPSGTQAFDWEVPPEWNISEAYVANSDGERVIDFADSNLHVVGYSEPVDCELTFRELEPYLHYLVDQPDAIPYVTSYYKRRWGFCITHRHYQELAAHPDRRYRVKIDSTIEAGEMNFADVVLPGETHEEIFFSTYVCHPSMANNELSGPCVQIALARWIRDAIPNRRYTYRFYFGPETIGSIAYLSQHLSNLRQRVRAGFVLSCLGDERCYSYLASRQGDTLADRVSQHILGHMPEGYQRYSYLDRGSDERQYCSPGVDLPVCTLARSLYMHYPEYHTSLDNLEMISANGLDSSLNLMRTIVRTLEANVITRCTTPCEPQLGKRGLYPSLSTKETRQTVRSMMDFLAYSDGTRDLLAIAEVTKNRVEDLIPLVSRLHQTGVIEVEP